MNVIFNDLEVRTKGDDGRDFYEIEDLDFYCNQGSKSATPYLIVDNKLINLERKGETINDYFLYKVSMTNNDKLEKGKKTIRFVTVKDNNFFLSKPITLNVSFDNVSNLSALVNDYISKDILSMYKEIVELTKLNIDIYNDIQEALKS